MREHFKSTYTEDGKSITVTGYFSIMEGFARGALIIEIDTSFEPNDVGVRVWLNDEEHILAQKFAPIAPAAVAAPGGRKG
jgi:hypothetical protein